MVDAVDSKSTSSNTVWVQVPSPVPNCLYTNITYYLGGFATYRKL